MRPGPGTQRERTDLAKHRTALAAAGTAAVYIKFGVTDVHALELAAGVLTAIASCVILLSATAARVISTLIGAGGILVLIQILA